MRPACAAALDRARERLAPLGFYGRPPRRRAVRAYVAPWFFRLPGLRRFDGYATHVAILLRREPPADGSGDDLVVHELCHVWQMQHHPIAMPLSYLRYGYDDNPYEIEAREAAALSRPATSATLDPRQGP